VSDDPFDDIDTGPEGDGDPFEDLADDIPADETAPEPTDDATPAPDPTAGDSSTSTPEDAAPGVPEDDDGSRLDDDPFRDIDAGPSRGGGTDPFEEFAGETGSAVDDDVWEDLSVDPDAPSISEQQGPRRFSEVSKHRFCEQCPHFTGPPDIACTNEGTDIIEFVDMETVRLADCPVVEEREKLQNQ
jgi:hypothetical protein